MSETFDFEALEREVMKQADALTPELLPRLLRQLLKRDSLVFCDRHMRLLFPYIRAQINLTRAKRNYYHYGETWPELPQRLLPIDGINSAQLGPDHTLQLATETRDAIRKQYRATPCVCFKQHR
jgi:hypothetical protein